MSKLYQRQNRGNFLIRRLARLFNKTATFITRAGRGTSDRFDTMGVLVMMEET